MEKQFKTHPLKLHMLDPEILLRERLHREWWLYSGGVILRSFRHLFTRAKTWDWQASVYQWINESRQYSI